MKTNTIIKRVIDIALTVTLLLLMAFQVTEQLAHEWLTTRLPSWLVLTRL